jgi:hypothetical protein
MEFNESVYHLFKNIFRRLRFSLQGLLYLILTDSGFTKCLMSGWEATKQ